MMDLTKEQQVGELVEYKEVGNPLEEIKGNYVKLEKLNEIHLDDLWELIKDDENLWTYMFSKPFSSKKEFIERYSYLSTLKDPFTYSIIDNQTKKPLGWFSLMNFDQSNRICQIGNISFSNKLKRTKSATEAFYLLLSIVFDNSMNIRRFEWKCDNLNEPSKRSAERLGFLFEGIFRQHYIVKGRNRDTAWFSILDSEWSIIKQAFEQWLNPDNFDQNGQQKKGLVQIRQTLMGTTAS